MCIRDRSISDLAKIVTITRIIEEYINSEKYELAKLRLCDVKDFMMRVEFIGKIEFDKDDFGRLKKRVEIGPVSYTHLQHLKSQKKLASLKLQCLFTNQMMMK